MTPSCYALPPGECFLGPASTARYLSVLLPIAAGFGFEDIFDNPESVRAPPRPSVFHGWARAARVMQPIECEKARRDAKTAVLLVPDAIAAPAVLNNGALSIGTRHAAPPYSGRRSAQRRQVSVHRIRQFHWFKYVASTAPSLLVLAFPFTQARTAPHRTAPHRTAA